MRVRRLRLGALLSIANKIDALNPAATSSSQQQHVEHQHKARRLRGGGAGRVRSGLPGLVPSVSRLPSAPFRPPSHSLRHPWAPSNPFLYPSTLHRLLGPDADPALYIHPTGLLHWPD